jgi:hypothetical protein
MYDNARDRTDTFSDTPGEGTEADGYRQPLCSREYEGPPLVMLLRDGETVWDWENLRWWTK